MADRISQYLTTPPLEDEWRVLLSLAQAPSPAQACRDLNWRRELFSTPETQEACSRLFVAQRPVPLSLPQIFDGLVPFADSELRAARKRMASVFLVTRLLPDYQSNLRDRLLRMLEARVPGDGEGGAMLAGMMETTLTGMDISLETLKAILSPTARDVTTATTQGELDDGYWERISAMKAAAPTGFRGLDRMLSGGLHAERFMVILGAPALAKQPLPTAGRIRGKQGKANGVPCV